LIDDEKNHRRLDQGAKRHLKRIIEPLKWEMVDAFKFIGGPIEEDLRRRKQLGACFARLIKTDDVLE
jgi:hypothetical protein